MKKGWIYLVYLVLLVSSITAVSAQYYPYEYEQYPQEYYHPSYSYGSGFGFFNLGNVDFGELYDRYGLFIDAIIYGFIFFGIGSAVFKDDKQKPMHIGLGLFMTAALLLFEARNPQFRLLEIAGPWAIAVLMILLVLTIYRLIKEHLIDNRLFAISMALAIALWLLNLMSPYIGEMGAISNFLGWFISSGFAGLIVVLAVVGIILSLLKKFKGTP
jgi:hypothetical protein